ncbi:hypothetical protein B5F74_00510 [Collinsella sp. An271]|uniref:S-layer homology domain-containing protein n=1 Tax=Collinsella sp. An271 TaxID=1965616 RepID=UPI000B3778C5|nr:S-layer homology domain-containing protein [Collinsella sp. An271]OUO62397.1 hypothetical protein B5F74_00510 [Collinsella sp. An271]
MKEIPVRRRAVLAGIGYATLASALPKPAIAVDAFSQSVSATWQDPNNLVLIWESRSDHSYEIYKSQSANGPFDIIGSSESNSYRDDDADYPDIYYYKVRELDSRGQKSRETSAIKSGTNARKVFPVAVLMYHNFISEQDIDNGWTYDKYSCHPEDFEEDLNYFREQGYTTITSRDLIDFIYKSKPLPAKPLIISIDDGSWGVYTHCWPLLTKYRMKADFNLIGKRVDDGWDFVQSGGDRIHDDDPYCEWNEIKEMQESGTINMCSHTYGLHYFIDGGRHGANMVEGETEEEYTEVIKEDYELVLRCMEGWTHVRPTTMAYPYSRRSSTTDRIILANTDYEILMAGAGARKTELNYFVDGTSPEFQLRLMSRPCRLDGVPAKEYLDQAIVEDVSNGVNRLVDTFALTDSECSEIARYYTSYDDVDPESWYAGPVYYAYVNNILSGTTPATFEPFTQASRAMAATVLYRLEGSPVESSEAFMVDVPKDAWYYNPLNWAAQNGVLAGIGEGIFEPERAITREEMVVILYRYAEKLGVSMACSSSKFTSYPDYKDTSNWAVQSMTWATHVVLLTGMDSGDLAPRATLDRAQLATMMMRFCRDIAA